LKAIIGRLDTSKSGMIATAFNFDKYAGLMCGDGSIKHIGIRPISFNYGLGFLCLKYRNSPLSIY